MKRSGIRLAAWLLSSVLLACPMAAQAAPAIQMLSAQSGSGLELEVTELHLEITAEDPRPKAYLYTGGQSGDYYFIVWMSSNPAVAGSRAAARARPPPRRSPTGATALPAR